MKKGFRFIISGSVSAGSKLLIFLALLYGLHLFYLLASAVAFLCSVIVGFYMQKYFTFENVEQKQTKKQALVFFTVSLLNLVVNTLFMYFFVSMLHWNEIFSQILTIGIIACWNFFVYQKFVFK